MVGDPNQESSKDGMQGVTGRRSSGMFCSHTRAYAIHDIRMMGHYYVGSNKERRMRSGHEAWLSSRQFRIDISLEDGRFRGWNVVAMRRSLPASFLLAGPRRKPGKANSMADSANDASFRHNFGWGLESLMQCSIAWQEPSRGVGRTRS